VEAVEDCGYEAALESAGGAPGTVVLAVAGMSCPSCCAKVEAALRGLPGVLEARVDLGAGTAEVWWPSGRNFFFGGGDLLELAPGRKRPNLDRQRGPTIRPSRQTHRITWCESTCLCVLRLSVPVCGSCTASTHRSPCRAYLPSHLFVSVQTDPSAKSSMLGLFSPCLPLWVGTAPPSAFSLLAVKPQILRSC
jgi:copper chaperone CopZ